MRTKTSRRAHHVSLARALSKLGFCSRAQALELIEAGHVEVNGSRVVNPRRWVNLRRDTITVDGKTVGATKRLRYVVLHKPKDVVTTRSDELGRPTVMDLLGEQGKGLFPVGRLDKDSTGLLLFTNDHQLAEFLINPASHVPKKYVVRLDRPVRKEDVATLRHGMEIRVGGTLYRTLPADVRILGDKTVEITITEGKNRQIRRMFGELGYEVVGLHRITIGNLHLGDLKAGEWRELAVDEIRSLGLLKHRRSSRSQPFSHAEHR